MDLDFNKYCVLDGSPTTVLLAPRTRSKSRANRSLENRTQRIKEDFNEISFNRFRSASCRDVAPRRHTHENSEEVKRGLVYQSSSEVRLQKRNDDRKKIEFSSESASAFLEIIDSLCCSDEDSSIRERKESISEQSTSNCTDNLEELQYRDLKNHSLTTLDDTVSTSLHGVLKFERRKEGPFFEFSVKSPEVSYVARSYKGDDTLSWIYTFYNRRKGNANGWWFKDNNKQANLVGKMFVSYSLCTTLDETGAFTDSMVTEFVLYDTDQSRRSSNDGVKGSLVFQDYFRDAEMHPELEIAAISIQVPLKKTESRKFIDNTPSKMNVIIPAGIHGLPIDKNDSGPSSLLERWRSNGSCDCGGWDMSCSMDVYENPDFQSLTGKFSMDHQHSRVLFDKGRKVGFSMGAVEEGKYLVVFHAKLSALEAFSICIAYLHSAEKCSIEGQKSLHSDSLRVFSEEKIANLMDANAIEEQEQDQFKAKTTLRQAIPSLVLNPPFSPIARV